MEHITNSEPETNEHIGERQAEDRAFMATTLFCKICGNPATETLEVDGGAVESFCPEHAEELKEKNHE